ncbi:hypothetical protein [uncultured Aquimarina sp.]|uniref:hypothetical protein n=1 Tax=uncultured Aquimarina sp. TaxID=575652 RepID=UPI0026334B8B|nr:hypothetical protein [uncultured Aquimarina sp.]
MKKAILILLIVSLNVSVMAQETKCSDTKLYDLVFKEMKLYEKKAFSLKIGYIPDDFTINAVKKLESLDKLEGDKLRKPLDIVNYEGCTKFERQMKLILENDLSTNNSFVAYSFSKIISISDSKKGVLAYCSVINKKSKQGKAIGGEVLFLLQKVDNNWNVIDKKNI